MIFDEIFTWHQCHASLFGQDEKNVVDVVDPGAADAPGRAAGSMRSVQAAVA